MLCYIKRNSGIITTLACEYAIHNYIWRMVSKGRYRGGAKKKNPFPGSFVSRIHLLLASKRIPASK